MAAPHIIPMSKVGFNSKTRTVKNLAVPVPVIDVYNDTNQAPMAGMLQPLGGGQQQPFSFTTLFNPSGSAAGAKTPPDALLFGAVGVKCTIATTVSWTAAYTGDLITDVTPVTMAVAVGDALKFNAANAVGNLTMRAVAGAPLELDWTFLGTYSAATEAAIADALANGGAAPVCVNNTTTIGAAVVVRSWTLALNNTIDSRPDLAAATGYQAPKLVRQTPTLEAVIELPALATKNFWTDLLTQGNVLHTFSTVLGTGAGYVITITGKFYLMGVTPVALGAGLLGVRLSYQMDTVAGSLLSIALT